MGVIKIHLKCWKKILKVVKCELSKVGNLKTERTWKRINKEDSRCSFVKRMGEK